MTASYDGKLIDWSSRATLIFGLKSRPPKFRAKTLAEFGMNIMKLIILTI